MGPQLPQELIEALSWVGCTWPEADESILFDCGSAWLAFGEDSEKHAKLAVTAVDKMVQENTSPGITAFDEYWQKVAGEDSYLADSRIVANAIAVAFFSAAALVLILKILVIVQLIAFAIILAAAIAAAFFTLRLASRRGRGRGRHQPDDRDVGPANHHPDSRARTAAFRPGP